MSESKTTTTLSNLVDNTRTDKNTTHSYLPVYEKLFSSMKDTARVVGEVGIDKGGSIKLWHDYFTNAHVFAMDIMPSAQVWPVLCEHSRIHLFPDTNAYSPEFVYSEFVEKKLFFDAIVDDGPHTLASMTQFISLYGPLLTPTGVLVIEDVQDIAWMDTLRDCVPQELRRCIEVHDFRANANRYDDLMFVIDKRKS